MQLQLIQVNSLVLQFVEVLRLERRVLPALICVVRLWQLVRAHVVRLDVLLHCGHCGHVGTADLVTVLRDLFLENALIVANLFQSCLHFNVNLVRIYYQVLVCFQFLKVIGALTSVLSITRQIFPSVFL